jgi:hypothetical protein
MRKDANGKRVFGKRRPDRNGRWKEAWVTDLPASERRALIALHQEQVMGSLAPMPRVDRVQRSF